MENRVTVGDERIDALVSVEHTLVETAIEQALQEKDEPLTNRREECHPWALGLDHSLNAALEHKRTE